MSMRWLTRANMAPDTAADREWRLADRKAREELQPEFDRRLALAVSTADGDFAKAAEAAEAARQWMCEACIKRTKEILQGG